MRVRAGLSWTLFVLLTLRMLVLPVGYNPDTRQDATHGRFVYRMCAWTVQRPGADELHALPSLGRGRLGARAGGEVRTSSTSWSRGRPSQASLAPRGRTRRRCASPTARAAERASPASPAPPVALPDDTSTSTPPAAARPVQTGPLPRGDMPHARTDPRRAGLVNRTEAFP